MARLFDDASSEGLTVATAAAQDVPISMSCWFNSDSATAVQVLMSLAETASNVNYFWLAARGDIAGDPVQALVNPAGAPIADAQTSTGYSTGTWHHAMAVFASITSTAAFIDGGSKNEDTTSTTQAGTRVNTSIGYVERGSPAFYMSGDIAESAIWNVALSDAEVALLAKGFSPLFFQPQSLVGYWPLIRDDDQDRVGDLNMSVTGTPTVATHPPKIIYPAPPFISFPSAVVGNAMPMAMSSYRRRRVAA